MVSQTHSLKPPMSQILDLSKDAPNKRLIQGRRIKVGFGNVPNGTNSVSF